MPYVLKTCSRANVPCVLTCSRAKVPCVLMCSRANVPCVLTCSRANVPCVLTCSHANVCCVLTCSRASVSCVLTCHSVHPPFCWGVEPPTKFSKREGFTGPQLLEGGCWKRVGDFLQGRGRGGEGVAIFTHKKKIKI